MEVSKRNEMLEVLVELREAEAELKEKLKKLREEMESYEKELIENMVANNDGSFKHNGVTCSLTLTERISPEPTRKDELWAKMKSHKFARLFTINSQTLSATVKELKTNNKDKLPKWLEGLIKIYEEPGLQIRTKKS